MKYKKKKPVDLMFCDLEQAIANENKDQVKKYFDLLVAKNLRLVYSEVHKIINMGADYQIEPDDLNAIGSEGLCKAIMRFKYSKGNSFSSFAVKYIVGEIMRYIRDKGNTIRIPQKDQTLYRTFLHFCRHNPTLNHDQLIAQCAKDNGLSNITLLDVLSKIKSTNSIPIDETICQVIKEDNSLTKFDVCLTSLKDIDINCLNKKKQDIVKVVLQTSWLNTFLSVEGNLSQKPKPKVQKQLNQLSLF